MSDPMPLITRRRALKTVTVTALGVGQSGRLAAQHTEAGQPAHKEPLPTAIPKARRHRTRNGKTLAMVVDVGATGHSFYDRHRIRAEMAVLRELGFERVYFVQLNPGYASFDMLSPTLMRSIIALGDPNQAYMDECKRQGMEAWAVIKPYEAGGRYTIPHGKRARLSRAHVETVGGERICFDSLLSEHPEYAVERRPDPNLELRKSDPVTAIEIAFCVDPILDRVGATAVEGLADSDIPSLVFSIWTSRDNGIFSPFETPCRSTTSIEQRQLTDANGLPLGDKPKRCLVATLTGFTLPPDVRYVGVTVNPWERLYTIPFSMIKLLSPAGEIPSTTATWARMAEGDPASHEWGTHTRSSGPQAAEAFQKWGFEFELFGGGYGARSGIWADGWHSSPVYGIGRGKFSHMKGTPCEGYAEVREYWLDWVRRTMAMGFDGIDFRLQSHSNMVSDYANYGFNKPILERFRQMYGVEKPGERPDPLKLMKVRGEFFQLFFTDAARVIHEHGRKVQVHLRNCYEDPKLGSDHNELGFLSMPKVLLDWRTMVELSDEVTIKDYEFDTHAPENAQRIKEYAKQMHKPLWVHCYINQANALNTTFFDAVENDDQVGGVLLYELYDLALRGSGQLDLSKLRSILEHVRFAEA